MKRSEMLSKIVERIELMRGVDSGYYVYPEDETMAKMILNEIEEAGMRPPYDASQDDEVDSEEWEQE